MVTSWPKGLPGVGTGAERLAERITAMTMVGSPNATLRGLGL